MEEQNKEWQRKAGDPFIFLDIESCYSVVFKKREITDAAYFIGIYGVQN